MSASSVRPQPSKPPVVAALDARQTADQAAERLLEAGWDDLEAVFLMGAVVQSKGEHSMSLLLSTWHGCVCFVEDGANTIWLTHWDAGFACGTARRISVDDDVDDIVENCLKALSFEDTSSRSSRVSH